MASPRLNGIRACVFDAYGTLFDYASAAARCRDALGDKWERLNALWREKQLQYTWLRAAQGIHADFWQVTGDALDFALETIGVAEMLRAAVKNAGLVDLLDAVISVESAGIYKPHPKVYRLATQRFELAPEAISFQSSNAWDAYAASAFGMRAVWCNRYGQRPERLPGRPDFEVRSLAELPGLVGC